MPYKKIKKKKKTIKKLSSLVYRYKQDEYRTSFPNACFSPNITWGEVVNPIPTPLGGELSGYPWDKFKLSFLIVSYKNYKIWFTNSLIKQTSLI